MLFAQTYPRPHHRPMITSDFLEDLLSRADEIQEAAVVGHLDRNALENLNLLGDIQRTLNEAIAELEYRLGQG